MTALRARVSVLILVGFVFACFAPQTDAAILQSIEFQQLAFQDTVTGEETPPTDIGEFSVVYDAEPLPSFLNIRARLMGDTGEGAWIIRNLYLHSMEHEPPMEQVSERFPLDLIGGEFGVFVPDIEFALTLTPEPLLDDEYPAWVTNNPINQAGPVLQNTIRLSRDPQVHGDLDFSFTPDWHQTYFPPGLWSVSAHPGCKMPNIDLEKDRYALDENGCVPAACANSLHWLKDHPAVDFPGSLRDTFKELSQLMNRNEAKGVAPQDAARAKLDFIEAHKLPIHVKYQDKLSQGDVSSTSGQSQASDMGAPGKYPTKEWLKQEAEAGEDVEVNVAWAYSDSGKWKWDGAHAVVLSGMGETAGVPWVKIKHDNDQDTANPSEVKQVKSDIKIGPNGEMSLPGMSIWVKKGDGTWTKGTAFVTSVISESYDPFVLPPPDSESGGEYCSIVMRTIPPGGRLDVSYPNPGDARCYNSTLWRLDRRTTPPTLVLEKHWNLNKGKTRTWVNDEDYPVTVAVHNDDWQAGDPYPDFDVGLEVHPAPSPVTTTAGNPEQYGGFSLGGSDGSAWGFDPVVITPPVVDVGPILEGFPLSLVPSTLGETVGTQDLRIWTDIPVWNDYWDELGLVVDVLEVTSPGDLRVDCISTGLLEVLPITGPGRYEISLGVMPPAPTFEIRLLAENGLHMRVDCIGVPSTVVYHGTDVPPTTLSPDVYVHTGVPNPLNPSTRIEFGVAEASDVALVVYDLRGRKVRELVRGWQDEGPHAANWDGRDDSGRLVASGSYVVRLTTSKEVATAKISVVR